MSSESRRFPRGPRARVRNAGESVAEPRRDGSRGAESNAHRGRASYLDAHDGNPLARGVYHLEAVIPRVDDSLGIEDQRRLRHDKARRNDHSRLRDSLRSNRLPEPTFENDTCVDFTESVGFRLCVAFLSASCLEGAARVGLQTHVLLRVAVLADRSVARTMAGCDAQESCSREAVHPCVRSDLGWPRWERR